MAVVRLFLKWTLSTQMEMAMETISLQSRPQINMNMIRSRSMLGVEKPSSSLEVSRLAGKDLGMCIDFSSRTGQSWNRL